MSAWTEEIEVGGHVQRRACTAAAIQQAQINRGTAAMARALGDVAVGQQPWFVQVRVLLCLARALARIVHPGHEGLHRTHRPVAVVEAQAEAIAAQVLFHLCQRLRHRRQQITRWRLVAGHARTGEVVGTGIADIQVDARRQRADLHQSGAGRVGCR